MRQSILGHVVNGVDVRVERALPLSPVVGNAVKTIHSPLPRRNGLGNNSLIQILNIINHMLRTSIIHQDINPTQRLQCRLNDLLTVLLGAQVHG